MWLLAPVQTKPRNLHLVHILGLYGYGVAFCLSTKADIALVQRKLIDCMQGAAASPIAEPMVQTLSSTTSHCVQELDQKVEQALACPCLDDLKEGPCGPSFIAAFSCFLKSRANEKVQ